MLAERLDSKFSKERIYQLRVIPVIGTHTVPAHLIMSVPGIVDTYAVSTAKVTMTTRVVGH